MLRVKYTSLSFDLPVLCRQLEKPAAGAVRGGEEHFVIRENRCRNVRHVVRRVRIAEHQLAVGRAHTDACRLRERQIRAHSLHVRGDHRRIPRGIAEILRRPDRGSRHLVELHDAGAGTARRNDDVRSVDQRRLTDEPLELPSSKIAEDIALPHHRAIRLEAHQVAVLAERVKAIAVDGRCAARSRPPVVGLGCTQRLGPDFLSIRTIECDDDAAAAARALDKNAIPRNRHRAVAATESSRRPYGWRPTLGPFLQQAGFCGHSRAIGALPLRPVCGVQSGNAEKHRCGKRKGSALHHQENNADGLKSAHPKRTGDSVNSGTYKNRGACILIGKNEDDADEDSRLDSSPAVPAPFVERAGSHVRPARSLAQWCIVDRRV